MSKIAENKVRELGYNKDIFNRAEYTANDVFNACVECYDQAMQDFLEYLKHCSAFTDMNGNTCIDNDLLNILIKQFKNHMQNESED